MSDDAYCDWRKSNCTEITRLRAENEKLRAELEALKKYEREKWTSWAAALKETGDEYLGRRL